MESTREPWGKTVRGEQVTRFILSAGKASVALLTYGATLQSFCVPDRNGHSVDICLGYDTIAEYESNGGYLGAVVGRCANRIGKGRFTLNGTEYPLAVNNHSNHLHGGIRGFDKYVWDAGVVGDNTVEFTRVSPDGEEGYPGTLQLKVSYTLTQTSLKIKYYAVTDKDTVVNLTNHAYFNLNGQAAGSACDNLLQINADSFTENDDEGLPTGKILSVKGTPMDFTTSKPIGRDINADCVQLKNCGGYDHNFVLRGSDAALAQGLQSGIKLSISTTLPGVQFYSGNFLTPVRGKDGVTYDKRSGFCLETQFFPNSLACSAFKPAILRAGEEYSHSTVFTFECEE